VFAKVVNSCQDRRSLSRNLNEVSVTGTITITYVIWFPYFHVTYVRYAIPTLTKIRRPTLLTLPTLRENWNQELMWCCCYNTTPRISNEFIFHSAHGVWGRKSTFLPKCWPIFKIRWKKTRH